jgi:hypothetical protein
LEAKRHLQDAHVSPDEFNHPVDVAGCVLEQPSYVFFSLSTSPNQPLDSVRAASQSCFYNILSPFHYRIYCCVGPLRPVVVKLTYNQHSQQSISLFSLMWQ